jgi:copper chaperone CopZ
MIRNLIIGISGLNEDQSENKVKTALGGMDGIQNMAVDMPGKIIAISHDPSKVTEKSIRNVIASQGFQITTSL